MLTQKATRRLFPIISSFSLKFLLQLTRKDTVKQKQT